MDNYDFKETEIFLNTCEEKFKDRLGGVILIGEVAIKEEVWTDLKKHLNLFIKRYGHARASDILVVKYPSVLAVFMVYIGIEKYEEGAYWPYFRETLDIPDNSKVYNNFSKFFEKFLKKHSMPLFNDLGGNRYLQAILTHGGIPDDCLNDFFDFVQRYVPEKYREVWKTGKYRDSELSRLIKNWKEEGENVFYGIDKPVWRFIIHGGKVSLDFMNRFLESLQNKDLVRNDDIEVIAEQTRLPLSVIKKYKIWNERNFDVDEEVTCEKYYRKPELYIHPDKGLMIYLTEIEEYYYVEGKGPINVDYGLNQWQKLERPKYSYKVEVRDAYKCEIKRWELPGITRKGYFLFEDTGEFYFPYLNEPECLTSRSIWILHNKDLKIRGRGKSEILLNRIEGNALPDEWNDYVIHHYSLEEIKFLLINNDDYPVKVRVSRDMKFLGGDLIISKDENEDNIPLYGNKLPELFIPVENVKWLEHWEIIVNDKYSEKRKRFYLKDLDEEKREKYLYEDQEGLWFYLPLELDALLGTEANGEYIIKVMKYWGGDSSLFIRRLRKLEIKRPNSWIYPLDGSYPPVHIVLNFPDSWKLVLHNEDGINFITKSEFHYHDGTCGESWDLTLFPELVEVKGNFEFGKKEMPFRLALPILEWSWSGLEEEIKPLDWSGKKESVPRPSFLSAKSPKLLIRTWDKDIDKDIFDLVIKKRDKRLQVLQKTQIQKGRSLNRLEFDLRSFVDTVKNMVSPELNLILEVNEGHSKINIPVMDVTINWQVEISELKYNREKYLLSFRLENFQEVHSALIPIVILGDIWNVNKPLKVHKLEFIENGLEVSISYECNDYDLLKIQLILEEKDLWIEPDYKNIFFYDERYVSFIGILIPDEEYLPLLITEWVKPDMKVINYDNFYTLEIIYNTNNCVDYMIRRINSNSEIRKLSCGSDGNIFIVYDEIHGDNKKIFKEYRGEFLFKETFFDIKKEIISLVKYFKYDNNGLWRKIYHFDGDNNLVTIQFFDLN